PGSVAVESRVSPDAQDAAEENRIDSSIRRVLHEVRSGVHCHYQRAPPCEGQRAEYAEHRCLRGLLRGRAREHDVEGWEYEVEVLLDCERPEYVRSDGAALTAPREYVIIRQMKRLHHERSGLNGRAHGCSQRGREPERQVHRGEDTERPTKVEISQTDL